MSGPSHDGVIRFGAFEFDPQTGELRRHGLRVRLQDQPCKILIALLEKPGDLVTREELRERIWGDDTLVDFDHGLSAAINRLREALNGSAVHPRYVETRARGGYRFIAPVEGGAEKPAPPPPSKFNRKLAWLAAGLVIVAGVAAWLILGRSTVPEPSLVRLTSQAGFHTTPTFSPDGSRLALAWSAERQDNQDICVLTVGSRTESRLASDPAEDLSPSWSPDGAWIAFGSLRGQGGLYVISPDGAQERMIANILPPDRPAGSPDGRNLVAARWPDSRGPEPRAGGLFLVPLDGRTLYYAKTERGSEGIFALTLSNGRELQVIEDEVPRRAFAVHPKGIYCIRSRPPASSREARTGRHVFGRALAPRYAEIRFHSSTAGRRSAVAEIPGPPGFGLRVSPDENALLYTRVICSGSGLRMIEHFR